MHMIDWNTYREQGTAGGLAKLSPDTVKGYGQLGQANARSSNLGAKTRELIALAVASACAAMAVPPRISPRRRRPAPRGRRLRKPLVLLSA